MYESIGLRFGRGNIKSLQEYIQMRQEIDANLADLICRQECKKCLEPQICEDKITEMLKNSSDRRYPCGYPSRLSVYLSFFIIRNRYKSFNQI